MKQLPEPKKATTKTLTSQIISRSDVEKEPEKDHLQEHHLISALEQISKVLTAEVNLQKILQDMATILAKTLGAKWVNFWELTPNKNAVRILAYYGMEPEYMNQSRQHPIKLGTAWIGRAVKTGRAWGTSDIQTDPKLPKELGQTWIKAVKKQNIRALICVPTISGKNPIGGICIYYTNPHIFTDFEMRLVTIVANQAATAIMNARIFEELAGEKNKILSMINSLHDGLIVYDLNGRIVDFNPRAEELLWIKQTHVLGKLPFELPIKKMPFLSNVKLISLFGLSDFKPQELAIAEPQKIVFEITQLPLKNAQGKKIGSMRVLHDTTKEKESEEMKSNFVSIASHQLRTPLSGIKWALAILLSEDLGPLDEAQRNLIHKTLNANEHLISLVSDLLDVSRIEEGRFGYVFKKTNLEELTERALEDLTQKMEMRKDIRVAIQKPKTPLPLINTDPNKLGIAIVNVLDNALKYTSKGNVRVSFKAGPDIVSCDIKDTGIGIPDDQKKFIFQKFFRARNAIRLQTEGSGLGLWIANEIIKRHKGKIAFQSKEGSGSTFSLQFPIDPKLMPKGKLKGI